VTKLDAPIVAEGWRAKRRITLSVRRPRSADFLDPDVISERRQQNTGSAQSFQALRMQWAFGALQQGL
jgi:hypothetical protein